MRVDLNEALLQAQKPPASGRRELLDAKVPGLAIRITANGVFSWTVRSRLPSGKRVRPKIGEWPKLGIAAARRQARIVIGEIAEGNDPTEQKRAVRRAARRSSLPTVAERLVRWQEERQDKWSVRYRDEVKRLAEKLILPEFGERVLTEVTREQWTTLIADVRKVTPGTAS